MKIIFGLLCGLLYLIGLCFGWTYQEASVYICIYLWPMLCVLSTLPITIGLVHRIVIGKGRWLSVCALPFVWLYTSCYVTFTKLIYGYYNDEFHYVLFGDQPPSVAQHFRMCQNDLQRIADACNITYEEANIVIYVELFILIMVVNGMLAYIAKPYHKLWGRVKAAICKRRNTPN